MNKKTDPEDEPMYVKRGQLRTRRPLTPKAKLKAAKKLKAKTTLKKHSSTKKPHKKSIPKLKEELDILFGRFIKYRDGQMVDGQWVIHCITCHKPFVYRDKDGKRYTVIQAGHFMSRGLGATRYEPRNVNGQCSYCNKWLAGDQYRHGLEVDKKFGVGTASALYELAHTDYKFKREWLLEQIEYYKNAIAKYEQLW